ncbi:unnamed protein product [Allacma fusca]|uniref:Uncharacterized protein n=1 Tax=Allacma fusca TaxID=39272 RepID=A0A8J2JNR6_9HEXA|nr:unnamed protein product [Allacma fusca]
MDATVVICAPENKQELTEVVLTDGLNLRKIQILPFQGVCFVVRLKREENSIFETAGTGASHDLAHSSAGEVQYELTSFQRHPTWDCETSFKNRWMEILFISEKRKTLPAQLSDADVEELMLDHKRPTQTVS